jgi:hypothetical protein
MADAVDNAAKVAEIEAILDSGVTSTRAGDLSATVDLEALRKRRDDLLAQDPKLRPRRRPRFYGVDLGNAW